MASTLRAASIGAALLASLTPALAQRGADGPRVKRLDAPQSNLAPIGIGPGARPEGPRPAILLTGYWPPTNEAVRRFSDDPVQNPNGWIGSDWENRGYDVYSYFPEFTPPNCSNCGQGSGDFEVDYQDTSADWWPIANGLQPIAIITFSRGFPGLSWELEMNQYNRASWFNDYTPPLQPTPAPPDAGVPAGALRQSTLPVQDIVDHVTIANLGLSPFICFTQDGGAFLSEFIAYHGVWYQALHASPLDPAWCIAAGHVHVGTNVSWSTAETAAKATLRTLIRHVDSVRFGREQDMTLYCTTSSNTVGGGAVLTNTGSTSLTANDLRWLVTDAPANVNGILFYGSTQTQTPFGGGTMCIGPPRQRIAPVVSTDGVGFLDHAVDLTSPPFSSGPSAVTPGSTWNFQFYYRDSAAAGSTVNLSSAVEATFYP